jgi:putative ABC transport system permease protein
VAYLVNPDAKYYWSGNNTFTYVKLKKSADLSKAKKQFEKIYETYVIPDYLEYAGYSSFEALKKESPDLVWAFTLLPVKNIHLEKPHLSLGDRGNKENILIFSLIAVFILLIASINYVNMSTAKSAVRSKEVGIRKSLGSQNGHIIGQFLTESTLITFISVILSFGVAIFGLTLFNQITQRQFVIADLFSLSNMLVALGLVIVIGLLAGAYPAFVTSRFNAIQSLKGGIKQGGKSWLRSSLISFQFATSIFLIAITFIIYTQVQYLQSKNVGLNKEQTLVINNGVQLNQKYEVFKAELERFPFVEEVSKMSHVPFFGMPNYTYSIPEKPGVSIQPDNTFLAPGGESILGLKLKRGRFFNENLLSDTSSVIVNQTFANELGWSNPINKVVSRDEELNFRIVGIVEDFNYHSLRNKIDPLIIRHGSPTIEIGEYHQQYILVKVNGKDIKSSVSKIGDIWDSLVPKYPFEAQFMDEAFQRIFESEQRFITIFSVFSVLAILIAALGLFALTSFVLQRRVKEIAVRKVLGASALSILKMISMEFTWLVIIGGIVGLSGAFFWLKDWLNGFSYRIQLDWYLLAVPMLIVLLLTWIVVSGRSYHTVRSNPSGALKEE